MMPKRYNERFPYYARDCSRLNSELRLRVEPGDSDCHNHATGKVAAPTHNGEEDDKHPAESAGLHEEVNSWMDEYRTSFLHRCAARGGCVDVPAIAVTLLQTVIGRVCYLTSLHVCAGVWLLWWC